MHNTRRRITPTLLTEADEGLESSNTSNLRTSNEEDNLPYQEKIIMSSDIRNGSEPILKTNIDISLLFHAYGTTRRHNSKEGKYTFHVLPPSITLKNSNSSNLNVVYEHRNYLKIASMTCPEDIRNKLHPSFVHKYKSFKFLDEFPSISESSLSICNYQDKDATLSIKEKLEIYGCISITSSDSNAYFLIAKDGTNSLKAFEFDENSTFKRQVILIENISSPIGAVDVQDPLVLVASNTRVYMFNIATLALQTDVTSMDSFNITGKDISLCFPTCICGNQNQFYLGSEQGQVIYGRFQSQIEAKQVYSLRQPVVSIFHLKLDRQELLLIVGTQKIVTTTVMNNAIFAISSGSSSKSQKKKNFLTEQQEQSLVDMENSEECVIKCCLNHDHSLLATISTLGNVKIFRLPSLELIFCANFKHTTSSIQRGVGINTTQFECATFCFARNMNNHKLYLVLCTTDGLIYCFSPILL
ncbi:hypothetical protein FDP41_011882 [Naegleria fowleri]|uniref:Uncharacterized protein n=1 Tax=Naegleria fowleri TaxID=5763 RepID=A0A6A5C4J5_NAEFO|nr:uncharacterized protein FDP41_011882 [Naegleria fowleri]KAF0982021.1 hypothetical protein FDP41_011882 [Naegleria fowleri]CAG4717587.1 unnamed protein product [Naegleria fowleri]